MTADRERPRDTAPPDLASLPPLTEGEVDGLERVTRAPCTSVVLPRDLMLRILGDLRRRSVSDDGVETLKDLRAWARLPSTVDIYGEARVDRALAFLERLLASARRSR